MSYLENMLAAQLEAYGLPEPETEHRFCALACGGTGSGLRDRLKKFGDQVGIDCKDWRMDFAWPEIGLAVEVEGGAFGGRHTRGKGFESDLEKYHVAQHLGFTVYRCGEKLVKNGEAARLVARLVEMKYQALSDEVAA